MSELIKTETDVINFLMQKLENYKQFRINKLNEICLKQPVDKKTYYKRLNKILQYFKNRKISKEDIEYYKKFYKIN